MEPGILPTFLPPSASIGETPRKRGGVERYVLRTAVEIVFRSDESEARAAKYAFPRYTSDEVCKADSASAAVGMWLRKSGIEKSAHSFRHTIRDRLRSVDAPKEIQDAVGGWGRQEIGQQYGEGYAVAQLARWLRKLA